MGANLYDDALEQLDPAATPGPKNVYDSLLDERDASGQQQLRTAVVQAQGTTPDRAARVKQLATKTGLPTDIVERNFEAISQRVTSEDVPYAQMQAQTPATATWLSAP